MSKNFFTYVIIILLIIPIFGLNFVLNFIGNIFLLIFLVPLLIFIVGLLVFNSLKTNTQICSNCGLTILGNNDNCIYCGTSLENNQIKSEISKTPSDNIIEVEAEEIK
tara:strand:- start:466 stop:789 length:324 start_codon:yes stop_codon:yes gene_type:complete